MCARVYRVFEVFNRVFAGWWFVVLLVSGNYAAVSGVWEGEIKPEFLGALVC